VSHIAAQRGHGSDDRWIIDGGSGSGKLHKKLVELKGAQTLLELRGMKVIVIGERDGVQGQAIAEAAQSAGAEILLQVTQCFV
jgi:glycine reductase